MKARLKGGATAAIALFVTSGMLASLLGVRQYERFNSQPTWVVNRDVAAGELITRTHLSQQQLAKSASGGSLQNPHQLIGKQLVVHKKSGETFKPRDLTQPRKTTLSQAIPEGRVLFTLRQPPSGIPYSQLHQGDRLDVVVRGRSGVRTVAHDVQIIGVLRPKNHSRSSQGKGVMGLLTSNRDAAASTDGASLVMAVSPVDVYPLASISERETVALVLHSAQDIANGKTQKVGPKQTHRYVEVVSGLNRNIVSIRR